MHTRRLYKTKFCMITNGTTGILHHWQKFVRTILTTKLMNHDACILDAMMMKTMKPPDALQPMKMMLMLPDVLPLMT